MCIVVSTWFQEVYTCLLLAFHQMLYIRQVDFELIALYRFIRLLGVSSLLREHAGVEAVEVEEGGLLGCVVCCVLCVVCCV